MKNLSVDQLANALETLPLTTVCNITKDIAKRSKKRILTSGNKFYSDFMKDVAEQLLKPANQQILIKVANHYNFV